jgi:hypothetical protein
VAHTRAGGHLHIVRKTLAFDGAALADLGAGGTGNRVQRRVPQHEVGGRLTYVGAVEQQTDMVLARVLAAFVETVGNCLKAGCVAVIAVIDAFLHPFAYVLAFGPSHSGLLPN